jgi:hypothetical protein
VCFQCSPTATPALALYADRCISASTIMIGFGLNNTNSSKLFFSLCSSSNCYNCSDNRTVCVECQQNLPSIYILSGTSCISPSSLPSKFGPDLATFKSVPCAVPNCDDCKRNFRVCDRCLSPTYFLYSNDCITSDFISDRMGKDPYTGKIMPCQNPICQNCTADYKICTECIIADHPPNQGYLLSGICYPRWLLPSNYGPSTSNFTAVRCSNTFCRICSSRDYTKCDACYLGSTPQTVLLGTTCVDINALPAQTGADLLALVARPCADLQCLECKLDYKKCTLCKIGSPQYILHDSKCTLPSSLPHGFGANIATNSSAACTVSQCRNCQTDYTSCLNCKLAISPNPQYMMWNGNCVPPSSLPIGIGANLVTLVADFCLDPQCEDCKQRIDVCVKCKTNTPQYFVMSGSCVLPPVFPIGYGADNTNKNIVPCQDASCDNCKNNYLVCVSCKPQFPQKFASGGTCKLPSALAIGEGGNYATKTTSNCLISECEDCRDDYQKCTKCKVAATASMQTYLYNNNCILPANFPVGFGTDTSNLLVVPCVEKQCGNCLADPTKCISCRVSADPSKQTFLYNSHCVLSAELPAGTGANYADLTTLPCSSSLCQDCSRDYSKCNKCKNQIPPNPILYLFNGKCVLLNEIPSGFGIEIVSKVVYPCSSPTCENCLDNFRICIKCQKSFSIATQTYFYGSACYLPADLPPGLGPNKLPPVHKYSHEVYNLLPATLEVLPIQRTVSDAV